MCFGLNRDTNEKEGQIAHIDRNPGNDKIDNLVYLCLDHHNRYDAIPSLTRRITVAEIRKYRSDLYKFIKAELASHKISGFISIDAIDFILDAMLPIYREAADFYSGTHRSRAVVISVKEQSKSLEQINNKILPCDIEWTKVIVRDVCKSGWIRKGNNHYYMTKHGRQMLDALDKIPDELKKILWNRNWRPF